MASEKATPEKKKIGKWSVVVFFGAALFLFGWNRLYWPKATYEVNGTTIRVLVAETIQQQHRGLGKRDTIAPYDGMVFPFLLYGRHGFVMRDMRFPLDIIWLRDGVVVDLAEQVPLEAGASEAELMVYRPRVEANAVLELPSGRAAELGITIGTKITQIR